MRFAPECDHGGNAGLHIARNLLEPVKAAHPNATYADIYVLAGVVSIEAMGGPKIPFRPGRTDAPGPAPPAEDARFSPDGRLPDGTKGSRAATIAHVRAVFRRMGFNDRETARQDLAEHFHTLEWGHRPSQGPSTPQIGSQRLCIRE